MRHCERAPIDQDAQSYGTRSVPTTINVYLFLKFTIVCTRKTPKQQDFFGYIKMFGVTAHHPFYHTTPYKVE